MYHFIINPASRSGKGRAIRLVNFAFMSSVVMERLMRYYRELVMMESKTSIASFLATFPPVPLTILPEHLIIVMTLPAVFFTCFTPSRFDVWILVN